MTDSSKDRLRKILDFGRKPKTTPQPAEPAQPIQPQPPPSRTPSQPLKSAATGPLVAPSPGRPTRPLTPPATGRTDRLVPPAPPKLESQQPAPSLAPLSGSGPFTVPLADSSPGPQTPVENPPAPPAAPSLLARAAFLKASLEAPVTPPPAEELPKTPTDLRDFLQSLRSKMAQLAEDFAQGKLNRMQFQEIYAHYQKQRQSVEEILVHAPGSGEWRSSVAVGMTGLLRERHSAKILSYAIYDNASSLPLASVGAFRIDTTLLVPMLSSFRSAATEMFGAGLRSTEIEGGRWLCFVPGEFTTLMVLFSVEPARVQLTLIEDLHRDFEVANRPALSEGRGREAAEMFTRIWALDTTQADSPNK